MRGILPTEGYLSEFAHFIAGGKTFAAILKYESDLKDPVSLGNALAHSIGAKRYEHYIGFAFDRMLAKTECDALGLKPETDPAGSEFFYMPDKVLPAGQKLARQIDEIPLGFLSDAFSLRLTGERHLQTNPDNLSSFSNLQAPAAMYEKIGQDYIVKTPIILRGVFNQAGSGGSSYNVCTGVKFDWFKPDDSTPLSYGQYLLLKEKTMADQTVPRTVMFAGKPAP